MSQYFQTNYSDMLLEMATPCRTLPDQWNPLQMNAFTTLPMTLPQADEKPGYLTITGARRILATWSDLPSHRAQKMRTALATAAKALAPHQPMPASSVQMNCRSLSRLLQAPPATFGLSAGRMTSLCSELRSVLRRLGLHEPDRRGAELESAALRACEQALPRYRQLAILDFLRFLDTEKIAPEAVNGGTLSAYQTRCAERILCADPPARARQVASTWNWAYQSVPNWPGKLLIRADRADRYSFPFDTYPVPFQQDVERYAARLRGHDLDRIFDDDLFAEDGGSARRIQRPLRPASISGQLWTIRCAAGALVIMGLEQQQLTCLRDLIYPLERCKTILRFFLKRQGNGQSSPMTHRVAKMLRLLARDYCQLPEADVEKLADLAKALELPEPNGLTAKNTRRLRALMQPRARAMLLCFPQELMRRAASPHLKPEEAARLAMYATAMEILLICPMRRKNLAGLRLDLHLYRPDPRQRQLTHILISADEVKNERAIQWPLPAESARLIQTFITRYRPQLVNPGNPHLFGTGDKLRSAQHLGEWLAGAVTRELGVEFNIHLARHFAAWNFLRENPGQYEVVRQVLGHRNIAVTMAHYVGLEADSAAQHFDATVLGDRRALRKVAAYAFRQGIGGTPKRSGKPKQ
jgi:integrase